MNTFLYAMQESYEEMKKEIKSILAQNMYSEAERNRIFYLVGSCLHHILDYAERSWVDEKDQALLSAFRFANNSLKHNIQIVEITKHEGGFTFPITFPLVMPEREIVWRIEASGKFENQEENYKKYLDGKNVIDTCGEAIEILKSCEPKK